MQRKGNMKSKEKHFITEKIIPKTVPFRCPVCNGFGTVGKYKYKTRCHGCDGLGWVSVYQEEIVLDGRGII